MVGRLETKVIRTVCCHCDLKIDTSMRTIVNHIYILKSVVSDNTKILLSLLSDCHMDHKINTRPMEAFEQALEDYSSIFAISQFSSASSYDGLWLI